MPHVPAPGRIAGCLREMRWLTAERARLYAIGAVLVWVAVIGKTIWVFPRAHTGDVFGEDFVSFWAAGRLVLAGHPADAYVPVLHRLAELPVLSRSYEAFYYPPAYLLLCVPFALLSCSGALAAFQVATGAAFLGTVRAILRRRWAAVAALAYPAVLLNIVPGQNGFLTAAIIGSGLVLLDRRPALAGAILGLMVIKPHLALAVPIALLASRRWRSLAWAGGSALCLLALSLLLLGPTCWAGFLAHTHDARATLESGAVGFARMESAFVVARLAGLGTVAAYAAQALSAGLAVGALLWLQRRHVPPAVERAGICIASLLMTPFVLHYDMVLLALPLAWMLRHWIDQGFPPWSKLLLLVTFCAPAAYLWTPIPFGLPALLLFGGYLVWWVHATGPDRLAVPPRGGAAVVLTSRA